MTPTKFDTHLVPLYRHTRLAGNTRVGVLRLATADLANAFNAIRLDERKFGIIACETVDCDVAAKTLVRVKLEDPATHLGLLADVFDDVLKFGDGRSNEPRFFWLQHGLAYSDEDLKKIPVYVNYKLVIELVSLLSEGAAYFDKGSQELIYLKPEKITLKVKYLAVDLDKLPREALKALLEQFKSTDKLRDELLPILADTVVSYVRGIEPSRRFSALLSHLPEVQREFDDGRRLYVASFSYERVRSQLEADVLEELARINKTFADVQGQILGIPVATVLVATQFKLTKEWGAQAWINSAVLLGVFVFVFLAYFVMSNQRHTLETLAREIDRKEKKVLSEYKTVQDIVLKQFPMLHARLRAQQNLFVAVQLILFAGFALAVVVYSAMTAPAWEALKLCFDYFNGIYIYLATGLESAAK